MTERREALRLAFTLALGAAVSLGLARFSYALLLPPMREDLGWSYALSGLMNAANAAGYLIGAMSLPALTARLGARRLLILGSVLAALFMALHGAVRSDGAMLAVRTATGVASGFVFASGGLLAARLATQATPLGLSPGLILGIYYGGAGWGIVLSALCVPLFVDDLLPGLMATGGVSAWPAAWGALAGLAVLAALWMCWAVPRSAAEPAAQRGSGEAAVGQLAFGIAGYFLFGVGYIGYMTFIVTLLRESGLASEVVALFYAVLGLAVVVSPWLWAGLLQRERGGGALARLNGLLGLAVILPLLWLHPIPAFVSGAIFGAVFLSVVASTTAMVRHNLPPERWSAGIAAFTIVFACGQILGPAITGWISDRGGDLTSGLAFSAASLLLGALLASLQHPLASDRDEPVSKSH
jgi:predicted MFS family arabinose efflux permease